MKNANVLISGASIAGPALAFWLRRYGFNPTIVERAPMLREGGHAVDFRGQAHMHVLERMGILESIRAMQTSPNDLCIVDENGKRLVTLPAVFTGGDVEIQRGDLSRILYDATKDDTKYIFDDSIASMTEHPGGVDVTFVRGAPQTFDLVVGADGLHSGVRALAFGDESQLLKFHGYYVAGFTGPNFLGLDRASLLYSVPGRCAGLGSARRKEEATMMFVFASSLIDYDRRNIGQQKRIVADTFAGMGWETAKLVEAMWKAPDLYFDAIGRVDVDACSKGRTVLLGDAGYGGTIGGQGTGLAIVSAYILAGELALAFGDYRVAFARYEEQIRGYAKQCQDGAKRVGPFYAPVTRYGTWLRNQAYRTLTSKPLSGLFERMVRHSANAISLRDYPSAQSH